MDGQEQEALISLRDARKELQHATKSRRFYPKGGGRARSTGKSIDELNEEGDAMQSMWFHRPLERRLHTTCQKPKEEIPSAKSKGKSRRFRRGKSNGKGRGSSNYPIVQVYNDGSKTHTSHMKVLPGYAVLDCGAAKSLCGAKPGARMAQTCAREGKRVGDERDTEAIDESHHFRGIGK